MLSFSTGAFRHLIGVETRIPRKPIPSHGTEHSLLFLLFYPYYIPKGIWFNENNHGTTSNQNPSVVISLNLMTLYISVLLTIK